jgi:L-ascorbate metabolism protein UlaG (beta-lactamase superfamily)
MPAEAPRRFANADPRHRPNDWRAVLRWAVFDRLIGRRRIRPPGPAAPWVAVDRPRILDPAGGSRLTWIGHASYLGWLGGGAFVIDPVFSSRIGGVVPRHGRPGLTARDLPPLAALLVTHAHYDHLDRPSVESLPRSLPVVVPRGLGRWFARLGFTHVDELDWWGSRTCGPLRITLVPARHWSRRSPWDTNRTLWGGFVVEGGGHSIYHAGDSAWFDGFAEIGRRFPKLDAAILPIGAYDPAWFMEQHHMNPEQAGRAFLATRARCLVPSHWGAFKLSDEPLVEPIERLRRWWGENPPADGARLVIPAVGETMALDA